MEETAMLIDNKMVKDDHKEGISRVIQRDKEKRDGHDGCMGMHGKEKGKDGFKVPNNAKSPRRA
jgi:ribosomal protein L19E